MRLGIGYNLFDGEELLEPSLHSVRSNADYIVVVYQTISNFGEEAHPKLESFLKHLQSQGLIDKLVKYTPRRFSPEEKKKLVSKTATVKDLGASPELIADQFFNELTKREMGRIECKESGNCDYYMSMDSDEFYFEDELKKAKQVMETYGYDSSACRMRTFFKSPIYELLPSDPLNCVPLIYKIRDESPLRIGVPEYQSNFQALTDPTRRAESPGKFKLFERHEIEMFHMSWVRRDISKKIRNTSNKSNHDQSESDFIREFNAWIPEHGVIHPHPTFRNIIFRTIGRAKNFWSIDFNALCEACNRLHHYQCSHCKKAKYCSKNCQVDHWNTHKEVCHIK